MRNFYWGSGHGFQTTGEGFFAEKYRDGAAKSVAKMPFRVVKDGVVLAGNVAKEAAQRFADQVGGIVVE